MMNHSSIHRCERTFHFNFTFYFAEDLDGGEYLFAFRMLMVLFRREFSFADTLYLWEVRMIQTTI